jgi:hypothetical protein
MTLTRPQRTVLMGFINWIGIALEVVGLAITGVGLWGTWREFAPPNEPFLRPVVEPTRRFLTVARVSVETLTRRLLRRPPRPIVIGVGSVQAHASAFGRASVRIGYGALSNDVQAALAELHGRTQELMDMLAKTGERLADESEAREKAVTAMREELGRSFSRLEAREQRIAVGGIRLQSLGLLLVAFGLILQSWPF